MEIFSYLPEDMMMEIFARLPVESIMRFKCIRKSWYALLQSFEFVSRHLLNTQSGVSNVNSCVLFKGVNKKGLEVFFLHSSDDLSVVEIKIPFYNRRRSLQYSGHCNGIICLADSYGTDLLCNPSTREFKPLPDSLVLHSISLELFTIVSAMGFGYDSLIKDYKVVRIVDFFSNNGDFLPFPPRVEVYTIRTDYWRELNDIFLGAHVVSVPCFDTYFKGFYYWYALDDVTHLPLILSFDMVNEVFTRIPMPDAIFDNYEINVTLTVLKDSIALVLFPQRGIQKSFDIWVLDEYYDMFCWTKVLTIGPLSRVQRPLVSRRSNELLILFVDGNVVSYNIDNHEINNRPIYGTPERFFAVIDYVKSLVSVCGEY